jgi:PKD repeat protein
MSLNFRVISLFITLIISSHLHSQSPPQLSGINSWYTGDNVSLSNDTILSAIDNSGNLNDASQATTSKRPLSLLEPLLNNHKVIKMDGNGDELNFTDINCIRSVFLVMVEDSDVVDNPRSLLGHSGVYDFFRNSNGEIFGGFTSSDIINGSLRINGIDVSTTGTQMPHQYSMISLVTEGPVRANCLSTDRLSASRSWDGNIAEVIIYCDSLTDLEVDSVEQYFRVKYAPPVDLGLDISPLYGFCDTTIIAGDRFLSYLWNTGDTTSSIVVNNSGSYWVTTMDVFGFASSDTIMVTYPGDFSIFANDTTICLGDTLTININLENATHTFVWSDISTDSLLKITQPGNYYLTVTDSSGCFINTDTLDILVDSFSVQTTLGPDKTICQGANLGLISSTSPTNYLWNTGDTTTQININTAGEYWLQSNNVNGCINKDTISLALNGIAPSVGFTINKSCLNESVQYTDTSTTTDGSNIINWDWNFGDGDSSIMQNPSHQFINDSAFTVTLTIQTDSSCENTITQNIQIYNKPTPGFSVSLPLPPLFINQPISFLDSSSSVDGTITNWEWDFGETGSLDTSSSQNPVYTYSQPGISQVLLIITTQYNCKDTVIQPITIESLPISHGLQTWYTGDNVSLSNDTILSAIDNSGNLNDASQATISKQPLSLLEPLLNNHKVIKMDGNGDELNFTDINCIRSVFLVMVEDSDVVDNPRSLMGHSGVYDFFRNSNGEIFGGFTSSDIINGSLRINGIDVSTTGTQMPHQYSMISLVTEGPVRANCLSTDRLSASRSWDGNIAEVIIYCDSLTDLEVDSVEQYFRVKYAPPVDLGLDISPLYGFCDTTIIAGDRFLSYLWNTGDTTSSIVVNNSGSYWVTTMDVFGFASSDTIVVNYPIDLSVFSPDTTICFGDTLVLNTSLHKSIHTFVWSDLSTDSLLKVTQPGNYYLTVTDSSGCFINTDTLDILVDSFSVQTTLGPDKTICQGANLALISSTSPTNYLWNTGDTTPQIVTDTAGEYWLQSNNANGCLNKDTINLTLDGIAPTVNFIAQALCTNSPAEFTNTSTTSDGSNIISETWFFGDGDSTTTPNPLHQYSTNTTYNLTLEIITDSGCINTLDSTLQIHLPPTSGFFTNNNPICSGSATHFSDNSFSSDGTINSWQWNFGDTGTTDTSMLQNPSYEYPVTNIYTVQLVTTSQYGCTDTATIPITVKQSPIVSFTTSNLCIASNTQFTNTSQGNIFAQNWDFGDFTSSTLNNPIHTFATSGSQLITLAATEVNGCSDTLETLIIISETPTANFDVQNFCATSYTQLFDSSSANSGIITNWSWNFVNHSNNSNDQHPTFSFNTIDTGYYYLDLIVSTNLGCNDSIRDSINIFPLPVPNFSFNPTTGSPPLTVNFTNLTNGSNQYFWSFGDDSTTILHSPSHLYQDSSNYNINLIATSFYGCKDSINKSIYIIDPITDIAINNVTYSFSSNTDFLSLKVNLSNLGTYPINNTDLEIEISGKGTILEKWTGTISSGSNLDYPISSSFETGGEIPDAICVRALNPNNQTDINSANNEYCITVNKFQLLNISPNPTASNINLDYIIPNNGEVLIDLHDMTGKKIANLFSGNLEKGLIRQSFNLSIYSTGIHFITITYQGSSIKEKILMK